MSKKTKAPQEHGQYRSPVGKRVSMMTAGGKLVKGTVLHQSAHLVTLQDEEGRVVWVGWGPGMAMVEQGDEDGLVRFPGWAYREDPS
jgi:hypothetical protein